VRLLNLVNKALIIITYVGWLRISVSRSCSEVFVHLSEFSNDLFDNVVFFGRAWRGGWCRMALAFDECDTAVLDAATGRQRYSSHLDDIYRDKTSSFSDMSHQLARLMSVCWHGGRTLYSSTPTSCMKLVQIFGCLARLTISTSTSSESATSRVPHDTMFMLIIA